MKFYYLILIFLIAILSYSRIPSRVLKVINRLKRSAYGNTIYLTFDDGPSEYTKDLLDVLKSYNIPATFFVVCSQVKKFQSVIGRMSAEGHHIALHSLHHKNASFMTPKKTSIDFKESIEIAKENGIEPKFFRPPWGDVNLATLVMMKKYHLKLVLWDLIVGDWKKGKTGEDIATTILHKVHPGDIICLHDGRGTEGAPKNTIEALKILIPRLLKEGYTFDTIDHYNKPKRSHRWLLNIALFVLIAVLTFYFVFSQLDFGGLLNNIRSLDFRFLILAIASMCIFLLFEALNVRRVLRSFKDEVSVLSALKYSIVGFFFSSITPSSTGGQPMQLYFMAKDKIPLEHGTLALLVELLSFQVSTALLATLGLILYYDPITTSMGRLKYLIFLGFSVNIVIVLALSFLIFTKKNPDYLVDFASKILDLFHYKKIEEFRSSAQKKIEEYHTSSIYLKTHVSILIKCFLTTLIKMFFYHAIPYFVYRSFGLNDCDIFTFTLIESVIYISVASLPLPGAMGISEGTFMLAFKVFFPSALLASSMLISRAISFYLFVLLMGLSVAFFFMRRKNVKTVESPV